MSWITKSEYIYAVSRIRAIEKRLLDHEIMNRLIDAATPKDAMGILEEVHYGDKESGSEDVLNVNHEVLLAEEYKKLFKLMKELAPVPDIFNIFLQARDFHNVKVLMKAEFSGHENLQGLLYDWGPTSPEKIKQMIRSRKYTEMSHIMSLAVEQAMEEFHHTGDPQAVDTIMDKACYRQMRAMADSYGYRFLQDFVAGTVDLKNISTFLRLKHLKKDNGFIENVLLPGGYIPMEIWSEKIKASKELASEILKYSPFYHIAEKMPAHVNFHNSSMNQEGLLYEFKALFIKKGKDAIDGLEPLVGYLLNKETEIRDVRTIMTGKAYGISGTLIRERLRKVYA